MGYFEATCALVLFVLVSLLFEQREQEWKPAPARSIRKRR